MKGKKNKNGDYVVTSLFIEDTRTGVKKSDGDNKDNEDDSDSDEGYGDEDDEVK